MKPHTMAKQSAGKSVRPQKKAAKTGAKKPASALTAQEQAKVRRLLESADSAGVALGLSLLQSLSTHEADWAKIFRMALMQKLVASWDISIWQSVAESLEPYPSVKKSFEKVAVARLLTRLEDNRRPFLEAVLPELQAELSQLFGDFFAKHSSKTDSLFLDINKLSDHAAASLSKLKTTFWAPSLTSLTDQAAAALAKVKGCLVLDGVAKLSDEAIESLARHKGELYLSGLTTLSERGAAALAKHAHPIRLHGLKTLSDKAAAALARHNNGCLSLDGLTTLPDTPGHIALAKTLAKPRGIYHSLCDLTAISDSAAEELAKIRGGGLCLGLLTVSDRVAESLSKLKSLSFPSLTTLSDRAAESLAKHKGSLDLDGLATLSDNAAKSLAKHEGSLSLRGLKQLSSQAAEALLKAGHLSGHNECDDLKLDFDGPVTIDLVFSKNKSNKFWSIALEDCSHKVSFGRIGTAGQSQTKRFENPKKALESFLGLVREKTDNGYVLKARPASR
jgi:predicted DNA-binding WGR domain protein